MVQFDWQIAETAEYSHDEVPSFVKLTTRSYLTITGTAPTRLSAPEFPAKATLLAAIAERISEGPEAGIMIDRYRSYRPYPVQAVWSGGATIATRTQFKLWVKQPLFVKAEYAQEAITQLDLGDLAEEVRFEELAEGTEIQSYSEGPLTDQSEALATLTDAIAHRRLKLLNPTAHREVYLAGFEPTAPALLRLAVDPEVGKISSSRIAFN